MKKFNHIMLNQSQPLLRLSLAGSLVHTYTYYVKCRHFNEKMTFALVHTSNEFMSIDLFDSVQEMMKYLQNQVIANCMYTNYVLNFDSDCALSILAHSFFVNNKYRFGDEVAKYLNFIPAK